MAVSVPVARPAIPRLRTARRWAHENLFSGLWNTLLTALAVAFIVFALYQVARFVFAEAQWEVIEANRRLFFLGRFPHEDTWRVWVILHAGSALGGWSWGLWGRIGPRLGAGIGVSLVPIYILMLEGEPLFLTTTTIAVFAAGYIIGHPLRFSRFRDTTRTLTVLTWLLAFAFSMYLLGQVPTRLWSGFLLTMVLAIVGIVASFPLGVLLAVGRASTFPVIRLFSVAYIELIRGVPLITILFMAAFVLPLMLRPERDVAGFAITGYEPSQVIRAMVGITLFSAAYLAETVRGGLQAVPRSQVEAAQALGLGGVRILVLIVLPQALRAVIPAIVGQFISLFKDTSLVFILGLTDLLAVARIAPAQPAFIGLQAEALLFVALIYWVVAYSMSRASQQLERELGVGER